MASRSGAEMPFKLSGFMMVFMATPISTLSSSSCGWLNSRVGIGHEAALCRPDAVRQPWAVSAWPPANGRHAEIALEACADWLYQWLSEQPPYKGAVLK